MSALDKIAKILVVIGAVNWLLVGLMSFSSIDYSWDLVALLFGGVSWLAAVVYILVGLSGIYGIFKWFR